MAGGGGFHAKKKIESESSWSNLPADIIGLILNHLYYIDHISFRAVCKGWREENIGEIVKSADKLPWMMAMGTNSCYLYDPFYKRKYTIENSGFLFHASVLASKHGWVLFISKITNLIFFYTPFTNKIIQLPELRMKMNDKATFINSLVSEVCEIFVVRIGYKKVFINMCRPGDATWIEYLFDIQEYEKTLPENTRYMLYAGIYCLDIEYVQGVVYCLFGFMGIGAFDVAEKRLTMLQSPGPENRWPYDVYYLIESEGHLFISQTDYYLENSTIFRLDSSEWKWYEVESLKNKSLFLGRTSLLFPVEEESGLMNTVHSYQCHQEQLFSVVIFSSCPQISQIYDWDVSLLNKLWIQPP